jgi:cobalt-precorrin 5A hydrolase/precorrin-3B C17-methyltransferase
MATERKNKDGVLIFYLTAAGREIAGRLRTSLYPEAELRRFEKNSPGNSYWSRARTIFFIMAPGIAVRAIAPLLKNKKEDPGVVVIDENGRNAISLLSGHLGGANRAAALAAALLGANAVIGTATDLNGLTAVDVFASENGFHIENPGALARVSARHLREKKLKLYVEPGLAVPAEKIPPDYRVVKNLKDADAIISDKAISRNEQGAVLLVPGDLVVGIGLNSGTGAAEIEEAVKTLFARKGFFWPDSLREIATHEKKLFEPGLREFARKMGVPLRGYGTRELNLVPGIRHSGAAKRALGVNAVAEPAALLASRSEKLLQRKVKSGNLTIAIARAKGGVLHVIGTGPGALEHITPRALEAIRRSDVVIGYKTYLSHIEPLLEGKEVAGSGMTEEVARAKKAVELAALGRRVSLISGGDPGVYGMSGLALEIAENSRAPVAVEVIPGVSALNACAARLGAPLMHDFAVISLSDRLTPWSVIEKRLRAAAKADFVIVIYNPGSRGRATHLEKARRIILSERLPETPVGIVRAAMRPEESVTLTTLARMDGRGADMQSTIIVGNSMSRRRGLFMITPRGYEKKYVL